MLTHSILFKKKNQKSGLSHAENRTSFDIGGRRKKIWPTAHSSKYLVALFSHSFPFLSRSNNCMYDESPCFLHDTKSFPLTPEVIELHLSGCYLLFIHVLRRPWINVKHVRIYTYVIGSTIVGSQRRCCFVRSDCFRLISRWLTYQCCDLIRFTKGFICCNILIRQAGWRCFGRPYYYNGNYKRSWPKQTKYFFLKFFTLWLMFYLFRNFQTSEIILKTYKKMNDIF